jgi:predicted ATPase/DNA-binding SARP family transcriptional activator/DNA-binding NarL/FixJ family response regulator
MQPRRTPQQTSRTHRTRDGSLEPVRIRLLGGFSLTVGSRTIGGNAWRLRKAASLVKLLALSSGHRMHREQVMDFLWPDLGSGAAANNLRHVLHVARRVFDPDPSFATRFLSLQGDQLVLCPSEQLRVDVEAFEETAAAARRSKDPLAYRTAIELYAGELLPEDRYEEWAEARREELRQLHLALLIELASLYEERGKLGPAVEALRRVEAEEPTNEEAHVNAMRLYAFLGRRVEALKQYELLRQTISRELGVEPSASARALREEIASGRFPPQQVQPLGSMSREVEKPSQHNLPVPRTSFVDRQHELTEIRRTLAMTSLLTLTGAGGSGKTRLALKAATNLAGAHPDGAWFVELAALSEPDLMPQVIADAIGAREQPDQPIAETITEHLGEKQVLLILDNCEHLVDAAAHLVDFLLSSCPHLRVLATSREPLGVVGEVLFSVPPLSVPAGLPADSIKIRRNDSVQLFVERARLRLPGFVLTQENARPVVAVCRRLEGLPLAIELAAARMGTLATDQMAQRLEDSLGLLSTGPRTVAPRQRTMRAAIGWSYGLLSEEEKELFGRLSVFAGGFTLEAAEAVCPGGIIEEGEVLNLVSRLVDKSLVVAETTAEGQVRYRMLEPLRQYAREELEESREAEVVLSRHAAFFLTLAERAEPELKRIRQEAWLEWLEAEHDNFRAALLWAQRRGEMELELRLGAALVEFWHLHVHHNEAQRWLGEALAKEGASPSVRVRALERAGFLAWEEGNYERAVTLGEEALELARSLGDEAGAAAALFNLGSVAMSRVEVEQASMLLEEAAALWRASGDEWGLAHALFMLGLVAVVQRDPDRAMARHEECLVLAQKARNEVGIVQALGLGALTALVGGDYRQADALAKATMEKSRRLGIGHYITGCLATLSASASLQDRSVRAVRLWAATDSLFEAMGISRMPAELSFYEPYVGSTRAQLSEAEWELAWQEGRAMSMEEAIEYALSEKEPASAKAPAPEEQRGGEAPGGLTSREREVATLVARGLTNRQMASELSISEHTVATHVGKIMRKLGLSSRSQLATWVTEQGRPSLDSD